MLTNPTAKPNTPGPKTTQQIDDLMKLMNHVKEKAVLFEVECSHDSKVFIAGSFNGWNPTSHPLTYHPEDGFFRATLLLEPGRYEYKFVVNGVWHVDIRNPNWVPNDSGTMNSVLTVQCAHPG